MNEIVSILKRIWIQTWNMPEGFATLISNVAVGFAAIGAAYLAWRGINRQISSQRELATDQRAIDSKNLRAALAADMFSYAHAIIRATSVWNSRAHENPDVDVIAMPVFASPTLYQALLPKIDLVADEFTISYIVTFYSNLEELERHVANDALRARGLNNSALTMAKQMRMMCANLGYSLFALSPPNKLGIPVELEIAPLVLPNGTLIGANPELTTIPELLELLGVGKIVATKPAPTQKGVG